MANQSNFFSDALRAAGKQSLSRESFPSRASEVVTPIQVRMFSSSGGFARTVSFVPGEITLLGFDEGSEFKELGHFLIGETSDANIVIRHGTMELLQSDITKVSTANLDPEETPRSTLEKNGLAPKVVATLISAIGLEEGSDTRVAALPAAASKRLAVIGSFFSSAPIVVLDWNDLQLEREWVEPFAECMRDTCALTKKVVIVLGVNEIPLSWKQSATVKFKHISGSASPKESRSDHTEDYDLVNSVENLIKQNRLVEESSRAVLPSSHNRDGVGARIGAMQGGKAKAEDLKSNITCRKQGSRNSSKGREHFCKGSVEGKVGEDIVKVSRSTGIQARPVSSFKLWWLKLFS